VTFNFSKAMELFSPSYFQRSAGVLLDHLRSPEQISGYSASDRTVTDFNVKLSDGSLIYDKKLRSRSPESVHQATVEFAATIHTEIDPARAQKLEALIKLLRNDGVQVTLYLYPYPPEFYEVLVVLQRNGMFDAVQDYYMALASKYQMNVLGS